MASLRHAPEAERMEPLSPSNVNESAQLIDRAPNVAEKHLRNVSGDSHVSLLSKSMDDSSHPPTPNSQERSVMAAPYSRHQLALVIGAWYCTSAIATKLNYVVMAELGSAIALSLFQQLFVVIACLGYRFFGQGLVSNSNVSWSKIFRIVFPLGLTMALASVSYNLAMSFIPVSFLNTIKSTIPMWTCLICWLVQGQKFRKLTKASLVPIVGGVGLASFNEVGFNVLGFIIACFSALNQTLFNLRAKRILQRGFLGRNEVQLYTSVISSLMLSMFAFFSFILNAISNDDLEEVHSSASDSFGTYGLIVVCGLNYFVELRLSYAAINALGALGYSITDVLRRLCVIIASVLLFHNPIGPLNIIGVCIAMTGIVLYNLSTTEVHFKVPKWVTKKKVEPPINRTRMATNVYTV